MSSTDASNTPPPENTATQYSAPLRKHSYDGIQEFDNYLPKWWLWTLWLACIFAVVYWMHYEVLGTGASPLENYEAALKASEEKAAAQLGPISNETLEEYSKMESKVSAGRAIFKQNCIACHLENASGSVGPNLTDKYWIHGGSPMEIKKLIEDGFVSKGMLAWKSILGPKKITELVAFILTLRNTNVPGKAPQGEPYEPTTKNQKTKK